MSRRCWHRRYPFICSLMYIIGIITVCHILGIMPFEPITRTMNNILSLQIHTRLNNHPWSDWQAGQMVQTSFDDVISDLSVIDRRSLRTQHRRISNAGKDMPESVRRTWVRFNRTSNWQDQSNIIQTSSRCQPRRVAIPGETCRPQYNVTLWTQNMEPALLNDFKFTAGTLGVTVIEHAPSVPLVLQPNYKKWKDTESTLKLSAEQLTQEALMESTDAIFCIHPPTLCHIGIAFNKPLILWLHGHFERDSKSVQQWKEWTEALKRMMLGPRNFVAVSNLYDLEYIRYYTGKQASLMAPFTDYIVETYRPVRNQILLYYDGEANEAFMSKHLDRLIHFLTRNNPVISVVFSKDIVHKLTPTVLSQYLAVIYIPHCIVSLRFVEFYRMNIPLYIPSLELLLSWQLSYKILLDLTPGPSKMPGFRSRGQLYPEARSPLPGLSNMPDPWNTQDPHVLKSWFLLADIYTYSYLQYFSSIQVLVNMLSRENLETKLAEISSDMKDLNVIMKEESHKMIEDVFSRIKAMKVQI